MRPRNIARGTRIRVLVVDDSVVIRQLITHALDRSKYFQVVGTAANGVVALRQIEALKPDVVTLDVEMPEMDGLAALREIKKSYPAILVIMFSTITERSAAVTLQALALGANDYVAKVANVGSLSESMARLQQELVPKLLQFFAVEDEPDQAALAPPPAATLSRKKVGTGRSKFEALAVGVSTGGPTALAELMPMVPKSFPVPIFIVQHMPALFTRSLAERLQNISSIPVQEASEGMVVSHGNAYLAPGDFHMKVERKTGKKIIALNQDAPENSCRPAVDVLFRSVTETYGGRAIGVVLTGMGQDGKKGAESLRTRGGLVIAQDRESSAVWGMPGSVVQAGLADAVLSLKNIVPEVMKNLQ